MSSRIDLIMMYTAFPRNINARTDTGQIIFLFQDDTDTDGYQLLETWLVKFENFLVYLDQHAIYLKIKLIYKYK